MDITCSECQNEFKIEKVSVGETVECPFCGIELEYKGKNKEGKNEFEVIEEEK
jgi:lysine biosynthesis protein LysW